MLTSGLLLYMPNLIIKLAEEKDPAVLICFENEMDARKINSDLLEKFGKDVYSLRFMPQGRLMNLMVIGKDVERLYKNLTYDYNKFIWWLNYAKHSNSLTFCHVTQEFDKIKLANTWKDNKKFILKVDRYCLVEQQDELYELNIT